MKVVEVKNLIDKYTEQQLKYITVELYKSIPKSLRSEKNIDMLVRDPDTFKINKKKTKHDNSKPDIETLKIETEEFINFAYNQYYLVPNRYVTKKERPKWRFIVKRLYKDLILSASDDNTAKLSSELLQKLYILLCHGCRESLFNSYDVFESIGIKQEDFFRQIIMLKYLHYPKMTVTEDSINLMMENGLNRYTLYSDLMNVIIEYLEIPDLKYAAIEVCNKLRNIILSEVNKKRTDFSNYQIKYKLNNLTEMAFRCYASLQDYNRSIKYFKENYIQEDKEISLYILLGLLYEYNNVHDYILEYENAIGKGVIPRDNIKGIYTFVKENNEFPKYYG